MHSYTYRAHVDCSLYAFTWEKVSESVFFLRFDEKPYTDFSNVIYFNFFLNRVVSGSRDATLRVWDIVQGKCLHTLVGHLAAVRCVQYDGKLVVSGAYDYMVKVWDPETQVCLHTLQGHTNRVYSLQVSFDT